MGRTVTDYDIPFQNHVGGNGCDIANLAVLCHTTFTAMVASRIELSAFKDANSSVSKLDEEIIARWYMELDALGDHYQNMEKRLTLMRMKNSK